MFFNRIVDNRDLRIITASNEYKSTSCGDIIFENKTTRNGTSTSLLSESINRKEFFCVVEPTGMIAEKTVKVDAITYCDNKKAKISRIPSSHQCIQNMLLCEEHPVLKKLPFLPLPENCIVKCKFYDVCEMTECARVDNLSGVTLTYAKLYALNIAYNRYLESCDFLSQFGQVPNPTIAKKIIDLLRDKCVNLIFDECHILERPEMKSVELLNYSVKKNKIKRELNIGCYQKLIDTNEFTHLTVLIDAFRDLVYKEWDFKEWYGNVIKTRDDTLEEAKAKSYYNKHLSSTLITPTFKDIKDEVKSKFISGVFAQIMDAAIRMEELELNLYEIIRLYDMLAIVLSQFICIHATRSNDNISVYLSTNDDIQSFIIRKFIGKMRKSRIIFTSATIGGYQYDNLFSHLNVKPKYRMFGENGDIMRTNDKMLIIADSKKYHEIGRDSIDINRQEICQNIAQIADTYGEDNCMVITVSIDKAESIGNSLRGLGYNIQCAYYRAPEVMGVTCDKRIIIAVSPAYQPSNSHDGETYTPEKSKMMYFECMHADTWQAWSRGKDQNGMVPSIVFALGTRADECEAITTWGSNRRLQITKGSAGQKREVKVFCDEYISKPHIIDSDNIDDMLHKASIHKVPIRHTRSKYYQKIKPKSIHHVLKDSVLSRLGINKKKMTEMSISEIQDYITNDGEIVTKKSGRDIYVDHLKSESGLCRYLKLHDINSKISRDKICVILDAIRVPYIIEYIKEDNKMINNFWLILDQTRPNIIKSFGSFICELADVKCKITPSTTVARSGKSEVTKLPFGTESFFSFNGMKYHEFNYNSLIYEDFTEKVCVDILDISRFNEIKDAIIKADEFKDKIQMIGDFNKDNLAVEKLNYEMALDNISNIIKK